MNSKNMVYKRITITIPESTLNKLKKLSKREVRSMSNMIQHLIEKEDQN